MNQVKIPDKVSFKIGEVAKLLELEPYVLRYWETEFEQLRPAKSSSGQRVYKQGDIEQIIRIRDLLYVEQFTIAGARRQLELNPEGVPLGTDADAMRELEALNAELTARVEALNAELTARVEALEEQRDTARAQRAELRAELDDRDRELSELTQGRDQLTARVGSLEAQLDATLAQLDEKRAELAALEVATESRASVDDQWQHMTDQLGEDVERLEQELDSYRAQIVGLIAQRDELEGLVDELSARLRAQHKDRARLFGTIRRELVGLHDLARAN